MQPDQDLAVAAAYASGNPHVQQRHTYHVDKAHSHNAGETRIVRDYLVSPQCAARI